MEYTPIKRERKCGYAGERREGRGLSAPERSAGVGGPQGSLVGTPQGPPDTEIKVITGNHGAGGKGFPFAVYSQLPRGWRLCQYRTQTGEIDEECY